MKMPVGVMLAMMVQCLFMLPANAQWQGTVGLGGRDVSNTEYDRSGRQLVREEGWLPGIMMHAAYTAGDLTWLTEGEIYNRAIQYHGQTQTGAQVDSTTSMGLTFLRTGGRYAVSADSSISAAIEWEHWRRDINGAQGAAGLEEKYDSRKLIVGAQWRLAGSSAISADAALVISEPERLRVGFSGILDPTSLETKRSRGIRLGASVHPSFAPSLEFRTCYDWIKVPRSADSPVTRQGQLMGTIAQPEHMKKAVTLAMSYIF